MWKDPIVDEVHRVRREIFARFDGDMDAYLHHLRTDEEAERARGRRIITEPVGPSVSTDGPRRRAG